MAESRRGGGAVAVGAGILLSRLAGLVRERAIAFYLGNSAAAGAFRAALRIPNLLQNLLGEGVLSASFIPVYARLRAQGRDADAARVARVIATLLALTASVISLIGVFAAGPLVDLIAPGFDGETRDLTVRMVQILFPGMALLVLSAWCLGVLNSHRRFFLSYASPVLWNAAIIATAIAGGRRVVGDGGELAIWLAWGAVIGSALQLAVQLPAVLRLLRGFRPSLQVDDPEVRSTLRAFGPVLLGRGSVQLSAYLDQFLASFLGAEMVSTLGYAQIIYLLPVSLFGMAVSAAELPEMASVGGGADAVATTLQARLKQALRRVVFLVVPSAVAFVAIGGAIVSLLFQTGQFSARDADAVWIVLAGSAIGLSAGTQGRLLASAFYALGDTKRPLYAALVRVSITFATGVIAVWPLRSALGYGPAWGAFGLTASAGVAAWVEFLLLKRWLARRIGAVPIPSGLGLTTLGLAIGAGAVAAVTARVAHALHLPGVVAALAAIGVFGGLYLAGAVMAQIPEVDAITRRLRRR